MLFSRVRTSLGSGPAALTDFMSLYHETLSRRRVGHLRFACDSRRYVLDGWELHCGDSFQVLLGDDFFSTRIESIRIEGIDDWVLIGTKLQGGELEGLLARSFD